MIGLRLQTDNECMDGNKRWLIKASFVELLQKVSGKLDRFASVDGIGQSRLCDVVGRVAVEVAAETLRHAAVFTERVDDDVHDAFVVIARTPDLRCHVPTGRHSYLQHHPH